MKIAFISPAEFPSRTAESIHVAKMCDAFGRLGHEVVLVCPRRNDDPMDRETQQAYYGVRRPFAVRKLPGTTEQRGGRRLFGVLAAAYCRRHGVDLVYGRCLQGSFFSAMAGIPVMFEVHTPMEHAGRLSQWMMQRLFANRNLLRLVAISESLRDHFREHYGFAPRQTLVAREAAETPEETAVEPLAGEGVRVGYVGHLYPGKGMEVVAELARACSWATFHVVGGEERDVREWRERCPDLRNLVLHGFVPHSRTEGYRRACDVLLAPYQRRVGDSMGGNIAEWMSPMKIFEYMASGKAIVASDLPAVREILTEGETGLLCAPNAIEGWVRALTRLRDDPALRARLGDNARGVFLENYTWRKRAEKILDAVPPGVVPTLEGALA